MSEPNYRLRDRVEHVLNMFPLGDYILLPIPLSPGFDFLFIF